LDLPPTKLSVEIDQPVPKADWSLSPSKSLTRPLSEREGAGVVRALAARSRCDRNALR
jgi:hypothetical protein